MAGGAALIDQRRLPTAQQLLLAPALQPEGRPLAAGRRRRGFCKENAGHRACFLGGKLLDIALPPQVSLNIEETAPPIHAGKDTSEKGSGWWRGGVLEC